MPACLALCLHEWVATWPMYVPEASILGRWRSMRQRKQKVPQELLQARGGFERVGFLQGIGRVVRNLIARAGDLRTRFLWVCYVTPCLLLLRSSHRPSEGRSLCVCVPSARQVHALLANARLMAHVERARMLGRACQDASMAHAAHTCTLRLSPCRDLALEWGWFSQVRRLARVCIL
jgi:hypothetical protein